MSVQFATARSTGFRLSALALAIAVSTPLAVQAQQPEVVDVIGQAAQLEQALDDQRRADTIKSVVHADAIGQLPDDNAAVRQQLAQLRAQVEAVDTTTKKMYVSDMVEQGYSADQIDADLRGERPGAPVGGRKALKSFKSG